MILILCPGVSERDEQSVVSPGMLSFIEGDWQLSGARPLGQRVVLYLGTLRSTTDETLIHFRSSGLLDRDFEISYYL
jgi:hypothetical protein